MAVLLFGLVVSRAQAEFTSIHIFGDGISTTTTNGVNYPYTTNYYGRRCSNGRVWVEVLAQELNLTNNYWYSNNPAIHLSYTNLSASSTNWSYSSNNWSYFGDYSTNVVKALSNYPMLPDSNTTLFVVWVSDADFVYDVLNDATNAALWSNSINSSLTNHFRIITNLYAGGVRTLIMPNAVDLSEVPAYQNYAAAKNGFIRQRVIYFNTAFSAMLTNAMASLPGLTIYEPDFFSLLDNILTNSAAYGLTNPGIDALDDLSLTDLSPNGPGTNYIWWDNQDPTAKVHTIMADVAKQLIAPAQIGQITSHNGTNQLSLANVPVGLNGVVLGKSNLGLTNWTTVTNFSSTDSTLSVSVPISGPIQFYRLSFPYSWTWP